MLFATLQSAEAHARWVFVKEVLLSLVTTRMSTVAFHLDYFLYPPVLLVFLGAALRGQSIFAAALLFILGLAVWTLAEYFLHRYALHHLPYFSKFHQAHHEEPHAMIGAPTLFTLLFFFVTTFVPIWFFLNASIACAVFAGFLAGYVCFGAVHQAVHHSKSQSRLMRYFKKLHAIHHHGNSSKNFGVTTNFWDHVFGTHATTLKRQDAS